MLLYSSDQLSRFYQIKLTVLAQFDCTQSYLDIDFFAKVSSRRLHSCKENILRSLEQSGLFSFCKMLLIFRTTARSMSFAIELYASNLLCDMMIAKFA